LAQGKALLQDQGPLNGDPEASGNNEKQANCILESLLKASKDLKFEQLDGLLSSADF
jgi:hypothetical protein